MPFAPPGPLPTSLRAGIVIRKSCDVQAALFDLAAPETTGKANDETIPVFPHAAVTVSGANLVIDFHGATLEGTAPSTDPDKRRGLGIRVSGKNITIKNAKSGIQGRAVCQNRAWTEADRLRFLLQLETAPALDPEKEDESDWQSYHHNEKGEWLRYGAGIYLQGCTGFEVRGSRGNGGQCGLMLSRSNHGRGVEQRLLLPSGLGSGCIARATT